MTAGTLQCKDGNLYKLNKKKPPPPVGLSVFKMDESEVKKNCPVV